jgi:uncharacterized protein (DUF427 family)
MPACTGTFFETARNSTRPALRDARALRSAGMRAIWQGTVLAASDDTVVVEGNHYFPATALVRAHFRESATRTVCPWKGAASYYDVVVGGDVNRDAAWYYPAPKPAAANIAGRVAFWKGVAVEPG